MNSLQQLYKIYKPDIVDALNRFGQLSREERFYELCYCIMTPQTKARVCDSAVYSLKEKAFQNKEFDPTADLRENAVRFHNTKAQRLLEIREKSNFILDKMPKDPVGARNFLVENVNGFGLKEASHFLRNTGQANFAILDRHILKNMKFYGVIDEVPKSLSEKKYLELEQEFDSFAKKERIPLAHLDMLLWAKETGEVFK